MNTLGELPVGSLVVDLGTRYRNLPIVWKVIEHNHDGEPENSTSLISDKILSLKCFDSSKPPS